MNIKKFILVNFVLVITLLLFTAVSFASNHILSSTNFEGFINGASIDGQGGWAADSKWDEDVAVDSGNTVWRVSNAVFSGSFGDMPFAPRPGGVVIDSVNDPVNSNPDKFAGESSTLTTNDEFFGHFRFRSSTGASQPGLRITVSADNGQGGRQSFFAIEDTGTALRVTTFDVLPDGTFDGPHTIADNLSYTDWHTVGVDIKFVDGESNDTVRYFVDNVLVHTNNSWEQFYRNFQSTLHPLGVPVQTLLFRLSSAPISDVTGNGLYIDDVKIGLGLIIPSNKEACKKDGWKDFNNPTFKNQGACVSFVQANENAGKQN